MGTSQVMARHTGLTASQVLDASPPIHSVLLGELASRVPHWGAQGGWGWAWLWGLKEMP